jgi:hypothetical protein
MNKLIALAFALSLVACVETESDPQDLPVQADPAVAAAMTAYDDSCGVVPDSEVCALACNSEVLIETFVPVGTCIAWQCSREDGSPVLVGGCH